GVGGGGGGGAGGGWVRDAASKADIVALNGTMSNVFTELQAIEQRTPPRVAEVARKAANTTRDWYEDGLKSIAPPAGGLVELPAPTAVADKSNVAAAALHRLIDELELQRARPRQTASLSKRAQAEPTAPVAGGLLRIIPILGW